MYQASLCECCYIRGNSYLVVINMNQYRRFVANISISFIAGQQSIIPSQFTTESPSAFNDTDGSPSSFGSTCEARGIFYQCDNNTDNPLLTVALVIIATMDGPSISQFLTNCPSLQYQQLLEIIFSQLMCQ